MQQQRDPADVVEQLARDAHMLAFDMREPARCHAEVDRRADEARRISTTLDRLFRGGGTRG